MGKDLWSFSLDFYDSPEVQATCLELQDRYGCDVNIVLFLLWRASGNAWFGSRAVAEIDAAVSSWRTNVVQQLRVIRRDLKATNCLDDGEAQSFFRSMIKSLELEAEKLEQAQLEGLDISPDGKSGSRVAGDQSLASYGTHLGTRLPSPLTHCLLNRLEALNGSPAGGDPKPD